MIKTNFKKGAASFYVVAFSTLILLIIVASFTALVVAQITRSSNADLSQSAYDSAMAGVEDAKLAFYSYQNCLAQGVTEEREPVDGEEIGCKEIIWMINHPVEDDCDMVANILGRNVDENSGVSVDESSTSANSNNMAQYYTCVRIRKELDDYRATLSSENQIRVVKPSFKEGTSANDIGKIRISWGLTEGNTSDMRFSDLNPTFPTAANFTSPLNPPVISVALLQAEEGFRLSDFDKVGDNSTNRGMVYLLPQQTEPAANSDSYAVTNNNIITAADFVKSNDRTYKNLPYTIICKPTEEMFACSAIIELPEPIDTNGETSGRSNDNFVIAVALPYGKPATDFLLEFYDRDAVVNDAGEIEKPPVTLEGMQIGVDSTGRANDLFRRVETRLEERDDSLLSLMGPLELLSDESGNYGDGSGEGTQSALEKNYAVTCEWSFAKTCE